MIKLSDKLQLLHLGAGDGITDDTCRQYIQSYDWSGTLIEPLPNLYKKLYAEYKNSKLKTLRAGISFESSYSKDVFWFDYKLLKTNYYTIYDTKQDAVSDLQRLCDELNIGRVQRYALLNTLTKTEIEFIPYEALLRESKYDIVHFCQPIVNEITADIWKHIQDVSVKNSVKLISYDKPNDYDTNLCDGVNLDQFSITNKGVGELDIKEFSVPEDYGVMEFDFTDLEKYKYRKDRNLIVNNEYTLG